VIDDNDEQRAEAQRKALNDEEAHYNALRRVFSSEEGANILEWLLTDLCGYWRGSLVTERELGRFELGRTIFNQVCMADIEIAHNLLDRRRRQAEAVRNDERKRIEKVRE
jgi:hypothetical protein